MADLTATGRIALVLAENIVGSMFHKGNIFSDEN
jgi:hypothetical protein